MISFMEFCDNFVLVVYIDSMSLSHILRVCLIAMLSFFASIVVLAFIVTQSEGRRNLSINISSQDFWDFGEVYVTQIYRALYRYAMLVLRGAVTAVK